MKLRVSSRAAVRFAWQCLWVAVILLITIPSDAREDTPAAVKILVVGDSISAAYGMKREDGWVALLQSRLAGEGYEHTVVNASISGDTTRGGVARLPSALERHAPEVVIIELGGNDGLRGISLKVVRRHLTKMVEDSLAIGARVVLTGIQIPSNYGPAYAGGFARIYDDLDAAYDEVVLVPRFLERVALDGELMQADGIHPNEAAQPLLCDAVWERLQPLLRAPAKAVAGSSGNQSS